MPSICGEALNKFGTEDQKLNYLKPMCEGKKFTAEALTEPRGGSDFFGATFIDRLGGFLLFPFFSVYIIERFGVGNQEEVRIFLEPHLLL